MHPLNRATQRFVRSNFKLKLKRLRHFLTTVFVAQYPCIGDISDWPGYLIYCSNLPFTNITEAAAFIQSTLKDFPTELRQLSELIIEQVINSRVHRSQLESQSRFFSTALTDITDMLRLTQNVCEQCDKYIKRRNGLQQNLRRAQAAKLTEQVLHYRTLLRIFDECTLRQMRSELQPLVKFIGEFYEAITEHCYIYQEKNGKEIKYYIK